MNRKTILLLVVVWEGALQRWDWHCSLVYVWCGLSPMWKCSWGAWDLWV